jgi:NAD(P)H-hydrate epimerase
MYQRLIKAKQIAVEREITIVLKGANTAVVKPSGEIYFNSTGNPGMATAGSGDVLTGMISGFAAQNMTIENATILAVYLHGLCGEIASKELSEYSVLSTDLINYIPNAIKTII